MKNTYRVNGKLFDDFEAATQAAGGDVDSIQVRDIHVLGGWRFLASCEINQDEQEGK